METIIKELPIPKEVISEVQEALPLPEPEPQGIGWGSGIALVVGLVAAGAILKFGCKKLKK